MKKFLKPLLIILVLVPLGFYLAFFSLGELVQTHDKGMSPTIEYKQYFWLEFVSYRFTNPKKGDVVVYIDSASAGEGKVWSRGVGRIVAVPGETLQIKEGKVFVNGVVLNENYIAKGAREDTPCPGRLEKETRLFEDSYIILGDNRIQSTDSRVFGSIPRANIIGKVHPF